jgi:hypothetical protein
MKSLVGSEFHDSGFMSTSLVESYFGAKREVQLVLRVARGHRAAYIESVNPSTEYELLLQRGTTFIIDSVSQDLSGRWIVEASTVA